jgi:hypothetical protein
MAGFDTINQSPSLLKFDIFYKSVEREFSPLLIDQSLNLNNKNQNIIQPNDSTYNSYFIQNTKSDDTFFNEKFSPSDYQVPTPYYADDNIPGGTNSENWLTKSTSAIESRVKNAGSSIVAKIKNRAVLGVKMLSDIAGMEIDALLARKSYTELMEINVYYNDQNNIKNFKNSLEVAYAERLIQNAATDIGGDVKNVVAGSAHDLTGGLI